MPSISRSTVRVRGLALALTLALAGGACTDGGGDPPSGSEETPPPRRGGAVTLGVLGAPPTLDPYSPQATDLTRALARPVYPSLFRFSPDGEADPYLAESWERDGEKLQVRLVPAEWSDGTQITAQDVVASMERAIPPSGFAAFGRARAEGDSTVEFTGVPEDWRVQLARVALILPDGEAKAPDGISGGPLKIEEVTAGLEIVFARNEAPPGDAALLDRVTVQFVQAHDIMLSLLDRGELDIALVPSSVNLDDRLGSLDLEHADALGWEMVRLGFNQRSLTEADRRAIGSALDRPLLVGSLVRDDGRLSNSIFAFPGPGGDDGPWSRAAGPVTGAPDFSMAAPAGDEMLTLMQRAIYEQLKRAGISVDVVAADPAIFYGHWRTEGPSDSFLKRVSNGPGAAGERGAFEAYTVVPIAQVETVMAWRPGVEGIEVNPTFEGPLWNVESWYLSD